MQRSRPVLLLTGLAVLALIALVAIFAKLGAGPRALEDGRGSAEEISAPDAGPLEAQGAQVLESGPAAGRLTSTSALPPGVRLRGNGWIDGLVRDIASGAGVPGVGVQLLPVPPTAPRVISRVMDFLALEAEVEQRVEAIAVARSGAGGAFRFEGVREGTWYLDLVSDTHIADAAPRVQLSPSGAGGPLTVWARAGGRVTGVVLRPDGGPATGARVMLSGAPGVDLALAADGELRIHEATTDGEGRFVLPAVAPHVGYALLAIGRGFSPAHREDIDVVAGQDTEVVLASHAAAAIEGRVLGAVHGADPAPLAGATVAAIPRGLRYLWFARELFERSTGETNSAGEYVLHDVPIGDVDLVAFAPGYCAGMGPFVSTVVGGRHAADEFVLETGRTVPGRVVDGAGNPVPGVQVRWNLTNNRDFGSRMSFAPLVVQAVEGFDYPLTDIDGRFVAGPFPGTPPHRLRFFKTGFRDERYSWKPKDEDEIEIVLHRGGAAEGIVIDLVESEPVKRFEITASASVDVEPGAPGWRNPFTGARLVEHPQGRFRLDDLMAGEVWLTFAAEGYVDERMQVQVEEGGLTRGVIVRLSPGAMLAGKVVDGDGQPIAGARVTTDKLLEQEVTRMQRGRGNQRREGIEGMLGFSRFAVNLGLAGDAATLTNPEGEFRLTGLEPASHRVFAFHRDYKSAEYGPVVLGARETIDDATIEMTNGGGVEGRVTDRFDRPVEGAFVLAVDPMSFEGRGRAGQAAYTGRTDANGDYSIAHMDAAGYFLVLTRGDEALNPMSFMGTLNFGMVTVPEGRTVRYDIVDTSAGACRVYGFVSDAEGPLSGGTLAALGFGGDGPLGVEVKATRIEEDGSYEFAGIAEGDYRVQIDRRGGPDAHIWMEVPDAPESRIDLVVPSGLIAGIVLARDTGEPIHRAEVNLLPLGGPEATSLFGRLLEGDGGVRRVWTDKDGAFRARDLLAGAYQVRVMPPQRGAQEDQFAPSEPVEIELGENEVHERVEIRLRPALGLAGRVTDADGIPVEGAVVTARRTDLAPNMSSGPSVGRPLVEQTDAEGRFRAGSLAPGTYRFTATADGFARAEKNDVVLVDGELHEDLELVLPRGIEVTVRVRGPDGAPVLGAMARLVRQGAAPEEELEDAGSVLTSFFKGEATTNEDGRLALGNFAPGTYRLEVRRGLRSVDDEVELPSDGGSVELSVTLR